jgi:hypothetical protein
MGLVRMGPPIEIVSKLRIAYDIRSFIETGTYFCGTTRWASEVFEKVITIEYSENIYKDAIRKYGHIKNIEFMYGDTRDGLRKIVSKLEGPGFFWLDAHWSGGETYGEQDQCPLIEELALINSSKHDHLIFIDDARLFLSPPGHPLLSWQWPDISKVLHALNSVKGKRFVAIIEDVIIAVPEFAKPIVTQYCEEANQAVWKEHRKSKELKGLMLVIEGMIQRARTGLQFARKILQNVPKD